jgi:Zn finger protein HypA/HybF involved in hydrogenase expression
MHDKSLLKEISNSLNKICQQSKVRKIDRLTVIVSYDSQINEENLREYLEKNNANLLSKDFRFKIRREDMEDEMARVHSIQGETYGD